MTAPRGTALRAGDGIVLRTPALPMELVAWASSGGESEVRAFLARLVERPDVREALFVASPSLFDAMDAWKAAPTSAAGQRVERSLVKYVARMMGRATPFGLFSAVSAGRLGRATDLAVAPRSEYRRRTRIDNDFLFVLADELARSPEGRERLVYRPNTSIYRTAGRLRYAAAHVDGKDRRYELVSVELTPYLEASLALAAAGATRAQLVAPLVEGEVTEAEAIAFVDELIEAQLIVPELGIFVTGPEPLDGLLDQLRTAGLEGPRAILDDVRTRLSALDAGGVGNPVERYAEIAAALEPLGVPVDRARLFQVDMVKPAAATIGTRVASEVAKTIEQLVRIVPRRDTTFDDFKRAFRDRYESRTMPLAEVLDEESGIGFETVRGPGADGTPLLAGLAFPGSRPEARARWTVFERHMLGRLAHAIAGGDHEIVLEETDLAAMAITEPPPAPLPDAFSATLRLEPSAILFEGAHGPSGARLLGRFCHASPEIAEIVRAHHAAEEAARPDALFAEIVHLNEGRIGNILCRPVLRGHEIVFLGVSGAPRDAQIRLDDLWISLVGERIVLTSQRLGKEIIPRLTTAHNFRLRSLGVYRFLCAVAQQRAVGVQWDWGPLEASPFLPRVRIGNVVVERAMWRLDTAELAPITAAVRAANKDAKKHPDVLAAVAALRSARRLPRMFVLAVSDNELPIDLDNPLLAAAFADEVSGQTAVRLTELFPAVDQLAVRGSDGGYANEVVLTYTRTREVLERTSDRPSPALAVRRTFWPGSEWLFAKIYCGEATADRVLAEAVGPVVREAIAAGDARSWFFIRYADPDPHLRVRFTGDPAALLSRVLPALQRALTPLAETGAVRNLVIDSYVREIERYGGPRGIELVEQMFWRDSEAVLAIVELLDGEAGAIARWQLAIRGIDTLLETLGLTSEERATVAKNGRDSLGREMSAGTPLWAQIGERFTRERPTLDVVFARDPAKDADHDLEPGFAILAQRDAQLREIAAELRARDAAGELSPKILDLAWSMAHMHANRILHASQRAQEMVLYDFIRRLHASRRARQPSPT